MQLYDPASALTSPASSRRHADSDPSFLLHTFCGSHDVFWRYVCTPNGFVFVRWGNPLRSSPPFSFSSFRSFTWMLYVFSNNLVTSSSSAMCHILQTVSHSSNCVSLFKTCRHKLFCSIFEKSCTSVSYTCTTCTLVHVQHVLRYLLFSTHICI